MPRREAMTDDAKFDVILADPPWRYEDARPWQKIENHYPTMSLQEICALPVSCVAEKDCVLFLWTTSPKLEESFAVIRSWGFTYKTSMMWKKEGALGMGYYARIEHEPLLIAVRGRPRTPDPKARPRSVVAGKKGRHSQKPGIFHEIIERMYPDARRLELFCRNPRPGWCAWGNQAEGSMAMRGQGELEALELPKGTVLPLTLFSEDVERGPWTTKRE